MKLSEAQKVGLNFIGGTLLFGLALIALMSIMFLAMRVIFPL